MKKLSTILLAVAFVMSAGMSFAATSTTNAIQNYQAKRDAAIKKHDDKVSEIQKRQQANQDALKKKQEEYKKQQQANQDALKKKQEAYKKQQEANKKAAQQRQQQRKDAVKNLKDSFKF